MLSVFQAAQLGLEVGGPLGQGWIIPYRDGETGSLNAQYQPGYRGLITLGHRSGKIAKIWSEIRYEKDEFEIELGTQRYIKHRPSDELDRGPKLGAYAIVQFSDGQTDFEYMTAKAINAIRHRAKTDKVWKTDEEEMWRKTPIRRLSKRMPLSAEDSRFLFATRMDEMQAVGKPVESLMPGTPLQIGEFMGEEPAPPPTGKVVMEDEPAPASTETPKPPPPSGTITIKFSGQKAIDPAYISGPLPAEVEQMLPGMNGKKKGEVWQVPATWIPTITDELKERGIEWKEE
jgi:recombination protein RecT